MIGSLGNNYQVKNNTSFGSIVPVRAFQVGSDYITTEKQRISAARNFVKILKGEGKNEDTNPKVKALNDLIRENFARKVHDYSEKGPIKLIHNRDGDTFAVLTGREAENINEMAIEIAHAKGIGDPIASSVEESRAKHQYGEVVKSMLKRITNASDADVSVLIAGKQNKSGCVIPIEVAVNEKNPSIF